MRLLLLLVLFCLRQKFPLGKVRILVWWVLLGHILRTLCEANAYKPISACTNFGTNCFTNLATNCFTNFESKVSFSKSAHFSFKGVCRPYKLFTKDCQKTLLVPPCQLCMFSYKVCKEFVEFTNSVQTLYKLSDFRVLFCWGSGDIRWADKATGGPSNSRQVHTNSAASFPRFLCCWVYWDHRRVVRVQFLSPRWFWSLRLLS